MKIFIKTLSKRLPEVIEAMDKLSRLSCPMRAGTLLYCNQCLILKMRSSVSKIIPLLAYGLIMKR